MRVSRIVGVGLIVAALGLGGTAIGSGAGPKRAIESGTGVEITDYDGHPHRTAPKEVGENLSLWCRSTTDEAQVLHVGAYHDATQLRYRDFKCPSDSFPRHHHIVTLREQGTYAMVISGAGFDRLIIRTKVRG